MVEAKTRKVDVYEQDDSWLIKDGDWEIEVSTAVEALKKIQKKDKTLSKLLEVNVITQIDWHTTSHIGFIVVKALN